MNPRDAFDYGTCTKTICNSIKSICSYSSLVHFDGRNTINKASTDCSEFLISLLSRDNKITLYKILGDKDKTDFETIDIDLNPKNHMLCGMNFYDKNQLLTWGKDINVELLDLQKNKSLWKSKCGARDELNLKIPIRNRDLCVDHSTSSLFVTDGLNTIKFFDISKQRKPVSKFEVTGKEDIRLDKIICDREGQYIYVSDVLGCLSVYDIRNTTTCLKRLRHSFACYSHLIMSSNGNNLGTVGLDRHFRGYKLEGGVPVLVSERYLKTRLYSMFLEGDLDQIEQEDVPFLKKLGTGYINNQPLESEKKQEQIHQKDKYDIEKVFPTRKETIQIKLRNRIKKDVRDQMTNHTNKKLKKVKRSL